MTQPATSLESLKVALAERYRVEREIGAGGMATVYVARDLKHDRRVALKVLKPELGAVLGVERFLSEIRVTANLQHPNLLPLFDSGEANGLLFYVMPFVEGESLRSRLDREKQLPIDEALRIALAVASALDYAHRHGVIHRDLKPENILLAEGQPLVADFGIALAVSNAGGARVTQTGLSLGTPQYMSPEQAAGDRAIDGRSDIYSLAAVLYEMLSGEPPHTGSTMQAIIARVMTDRPRSLRDTRGTVPVHVDAAIATALAKLPADRFGTAQEFAQALANPTFRSSVTSERTAGSQASDRLVRRILAWPVVGGMAVGIGLGVAGWASMHAASPVSKAVIRAQVVFPAGQELIPPEQGPNFTLSRDGSVVIYVGPASGGGTQLWRRAMNDLTATPLKGTDAAIIPAISPNGREIAFETLRDRKIRVISIDGGVPQVVVPDSVRRGGLAWSPDGFLYYRSMRNNIVRVPAHGGRAQDVTTTTAHGSGVGHFWPVPLPSGKGVVFSVRGSVGPYEGKIAAVDMSTGKVTELAMGVFAQYAPSGHLVWATADGSVLAATFNERTFELGNPVPVIEKVRVEGSLGSADIAFSQTGLMLYQVGEVSQEDLVWVSRAGAVQEVVDLPGFFTNTGASFALSPDGTRLAVSRALQSGNDIWIRPLPEGAMVRLTTDGQPNLSPTWTPDGRSIIYVSTAHPPGSVHRRRADGVGTDSLMFPAPSIQTIAIVSPDGRWLAVQAGNRLGIMRFGGDTTFTPISDTERFRERHPTFSPDGHWLAYASDETGEDEVYVRPFPAVATGKFIVSAEGGTAPLWSHSGREIFYRTPKGDLASATVRTMPTFAVEKRETLFAVGSYVGYANAGSISENVQVSRDDQRFLLSRPRNKTQALILVENWFEELKAKTRK